MEIKELVINGVRYQYRQKYLEEDGLWECAYVDDKGSMPELASGNLASYDERLGVAKRELEALIKDNELEPDVDNEVVLWKDLDEETQRKILVFARQIREEEISMWHKYDEDYQRWRRRMYAYTGLWFSKGQYYRLNKM